MFVFSVRLLVNRRLSVVTFRGKEQAYALHFYCTGGIDARNP